jgi:hypothetical protein
VEREWGKFSEHGFIFLPGFFFSQKSYHFNQLRKLELETNSKNLRNVGHRADKTVVIAEKIFVESLG